MKVLIAASECAPLVKVGGIADVIGSLPIALKDLGVDVRVTIPYYLPLKEKVEKENIPITKIKDLEMEYGGKQEQVTVYETVIPGTNVPVYLLGNENNLTDGDIYFSHRSTASPENEINRFAFFSKAVAIIFTYPEYGVFDPDVIHCHDWHTGLVPQLIQSSHKFTHTDLPKNVFTIHNLGYQGFSKLDIAEKLHLDILNDQSLKWDAEDDNLDFILQGIVGADYITTVSEKYAEEIQTPEFGEGLHDILKTRNARVQGILNGISYEIFNPQTDKFIWSNYTKSNWKEEKPKNKKELKNLIGLPEEDKPILAIVTRLAHQKGLDLVAESVKEMIDIGYQIVLLGTGDPHLEATFKEYNNEPSFNNNFKGLIEFSEDLARKIYAGSDMFLIPSRYEPCGLTQMISMKYGSIPVVRGTGGLYDTVLHGENGFMFENFNKETMLQSLREAYNAYNDRQKWEKIVQKAMKEDFSWTESAKKYVNLYEKTLTL